MAEAIVLVGLQGAGKTTFYETQLKATHALISGDIHGSPRRQHELARGAIRAGNSFAVDNTNLTRAVRAPFIRLAKDAGYRLVAVYFDVPVRTAIGRNKYREDKSAIPVPAILRGAKILEPPASEEGFDEIRVIRG